MLFRTQHTVHCRTKKPFWIEINIEKALKKMHKYECRKLRQLHAISFSHLFRVECIILVRLVGIDATVECGRLSVFRRSDKNQTGDLRGNGNSDCLGRNWKISRRSVPFRLAQSLKIAYEMSKQLSPRNRWTQAQLIDSLGQHRRSPMTKIIRQTIF